MKEGDKMKRFLALITVVLFGMCVLSGCAALMPMIPSSNNFVFVNLPKNVEELNSKPEIIMATPYMTAALTVAVLCNYGDDPAATIEMLNVLKGPEPLSNREISSLRDNLSGKSYKPFSFFEGATPQNNYQPIRPYIIKITEQKNSFDNENYATLYVKSGGADSARGIRLRKQPSTGKWFLYEQFLLPDIRKPQSQNVWS